MIHYYKFLTMSVKKLRRNGVDCRTSCLPVVVFLRDEVCGISEHLREASKFSAEKWTLALDKFYGWCNTKFYTTNQKTIKQIHICVLLT